MSDRPIIFSAPMVRALLDGRKTQTRRLATSPLRRCEVGDRLYVREAWRTHRVSDELKPSLLTGEGRVWFEADRDNCDQHGRLRPGMHLPRWASRLTLIVEGMSVQPLQAITEADARAEGAAKLTHDGEGSFFEHNDGTYRCGYAGLWDHLHGSGSWDDNPEVIALTFRVEHRNIDRKNP